MGFLAVFKVRGSGLTNKTEVDVLEALAFFMNDQSGVCFPSTDAVARIARVHPNVAGVSGFLCLGRLFQGQPNEAALCI